jgi:RNA polymerase sigma factor (sigma-70 family)
MTRAADVARFRAVFGDNYSLLLAYAVRRVDVYDDAKDVVADVFAVAWRRWEAVPDDAVEQRMWLYGIARRVLSNRHRSDVRLSRLRSRLASAAREVVPDHASNDDESDLALAVEALNSLADADREILLLSLWEELTPGQIATVVGRSSAIVSVRLHRAKARLRKEFELLVKDPVDGGHVLGERAHGDTAPETTQ